MPYNMTNIMGTGNETSIVTFIQGINTVLMDGMLGAMFLGGIAMVMLVSFYFNNRDFAASFLATSFISFTFALGLVALHLVGQEALYITAFCTMLGLIFTWSR